MSVAIALTDQDKNTLRTAAYGAVTLVAWAAGANSPHKVATAGSIALYAATGPVGHVLAKKSNVEGLNGKSAAAVADEVLPALTAAMSLLKKQDAAEADNFRSIVTIAVEAATRAQKGAPSPTVADMTRKITTALDAA